MDLERVKDVIQERVVLAERKLTKIGDVLVINGEPRDGNPYKGPQVYAEARREALRLFRDGRDVGELTFWHAPASGGARRITDKSQIDWRGMS